MNDKNFSVSMCVYEKDNVEWFLLALNSVIEQTIIPDEIVLVVDGYIPQPIEDVITNFQVVCQSKKVEFNVYRFETNQGHGNARRLGLEKCKNEIVALMDADDVCLPNRFEQQLKMIVEENLDIVGGDISEFIDDESNVVSYRKVPQNDKEIKEYLKKRCPFNQVTVMFKKNTVIDAGGYVDWYCEEDYYLWLRMYLKGAKMANTGTVVVNVRVGKDMYKRRGGLKYYKSEKALQKYMLKKKIIGYSTYLSNCAKRLIVQVLMPNWLRSIVFKKFARKKG